MKSKFSWLFLLFGLIYCIMTMAAPQKDLWPYWQTTDSKSKLTINNQSYLYFLNKYVDRGPDNTNLVAYSKVSSADKEALNKYIQYLSSIKISGYNRQEQLAYWINLYNALTIKVVLDNYPTKSILDIKLSGLLTPGPWEKKLIKVEGQQLSLNDIEHRIVRPIWNDPRTHFALNCASYGCPNLQKSPYSGKTLDSMLDNDAREYINSPRGVYFDPQGKLIVSQIFSWYQTDFASNDKDLIRFIAKYANPSLAQKLAGKTKIDSYQYDWKLNGN